jgi:urease accessory protein
MTKTARVLLTYPAFLSQSSAYAHSFPPAKILHCAVPRGIFSFIRRVAGRRTRGGNVLDRRRRASTCGGTALKMEPSAAGTGSLRFECVANRTAVVESFASSPLKLIHPSNHGSAAWAVNSTYGGGLVGGDAIELKIEAGEKTQAVFMTQASTKVYRSGLATRQHLECNVGNDALFVAAPDRVACFAGSNLQQSQRYTLAPAASLVLVDWLSAGRIESGERWQFDRYSNRVEIWRESRLLLLDALLLDSAHGSIAARMKRFNTLATVVITGPALAQAASHLLKSNGETEIEARADKRIAASPLGEDGALLRLAAVDVESLGAQLRKILRFVCDIIGDDPWARRW